MTTQDSDFRSGSIEILHSSLAQGPHWFCKVKVVNDSSCHWTSEHDGQVFLCYHWLSEFWTIVVWEGRRSELPVGGVAAKKSAVGLLLVDPPPYPGRFHLMITVVRENYYWFDKSPELFQSAVCTVDVSAIEGPCTAPTETRNWSGNYPKVEFPHDEKQEPATQARVHSKCIFTYDLFRGVDFGLPSVRNNCDRIHGLAIDSLRMAGISCKSFTPSSEGGECDVESYRKAIELPATPQGWAKATSMEIPAEQRGYFAGLLNADLILGWGLTPAMMRLIDSSGITFLDVEIDPIRFGNNLYFRARSNDPRMVANLRAIHQGESALTAAVANIRSFVAARRAKTLKRGPKLGAFFGQSRIDLAIVENGNLVDPVEHLERIKEIAGSVDRFLIKPHPYEPDSGHLDVLFREIPNAVFCKANVYRMLADINLREVVAISSSVLAEADLFGINSTTLASIDRDHSALVPPRAREWFRISGDAMASGVLWRATGTPGEVRFEKSSYSENAPQSIDLRKNLGFGWGIDSITDLEDSFPL
jgi:hypothetical protein